MFLYTIFRLRLENFPRSASSSIFCMDLLSAFNIARFKFQGSSSNTLEVMSICLNHISWKNSGRIVRLSLKIWPAMNLNRVQVFWKKKFGCRILDLGESNNFLSIAPHFWKLFFKKKFVILSPTHDSKIF